MMLTSPTALAVWTCELKQQITDGMWKDKQDFFWHDMEVGIGPQNLVKVNDQSTCTKNGYNFSALYDTFGRRMLAYGRMAKAGADPTDRDLIEAAEYMPTTLREFELFKIIGFSPRIALGSYQAARLDRVSHHLAKCFYVTTYDMKDLRRDIRLIKSTMKTAPLSN